MICGSKVSLFVATVAILLVGVKWQRSTQQVSSYLPWHEGPYWERMLSIYDDLAAELYRGCFSRYVATPYGSTHVFTCGDPTDWLKFPAILFLHGGSSTSLDYGDWLIPPIVQQGDHFVIAADIPCETGRTIPLDGDPSNCPQTKEALAQWVEELVMGLYNDDILLPNKTKSDDPSAGQPQLSPTVSIVGYSYGSFIASLVALHKPALVNRLALLAPAGVFADFELSFLWRSLLYDLLKSNERVEQWFFRSLSAEPDKFDMKQWPEIYQNQSAAIRELGATVAAVWPQKLDEEDIAQLVQGHPTALFIGANETLIDVDVAVEMAQKYGVQYYVYPNAGHLMIIEDAREHIQRDVVSFLLDGTIGDDDAKQSV